MRSLKHTFVPMLLATVGCGLLARDVHAEPAPAAPSSDLRTPGERFAQLSTADHPSFRRDVVPLMARVGCSARECHGSFQGRGGFRLSLFGSEFDQDFVQITQTKGDEDEIRVNLTDPPKSLVLLKPTLQVHHKGKLRIKKDSWEYNLMLRWIQDGAKNDADASGELDRLEVVPSEVIFTRPGETRQLRVLAHWKDGSVRDVTQLTRFHTNDEAITAVSDVGLVSAVGKGDSDVVVSYDNGVVPIPVILAVSDRTGLRFPVVAQRNKVDELVVEKLRKVGEVPSDLCTDTEFLRRVSLDLTGTLPTPDQVTRFLADPSPDKRSAKIDELLSSPTYAAWWTTRLCDYTGDSATVNVNNLGRVSPGEISRQWYDWLYKRVAGNTPYDQIVAGIVLATSRTSPEQSYKDFAVEMSSYFRSDHPADFADHPTLPYFWQRRNVNTPQEKGLAFAHAFLGIRLECAQCHKHPFDRWTKSDFAQFTAFFAPISVRARPPVPGEEVSYQALTKEIRAKAEETASHESDDPAKQRKLEQQALRLEVQRRIDAGQPVPWPEVWVDNRPGAQGGKFRKQNGDNRVFTPKLLGGEQVLLTQYPDPRKPLMDWLRDKGNPYFAKAFANRVWAAYFGRGIVDPPDDLNLANAPSNPALLQYLADGFVAHGYDMKWLHREILNSATYQRSWRTNSTNELDARNFSHAAIRQLPAEVMLDAMDQATSSDGRLATFATDLDGRAVGPAAVAAGQKAKGGKPQRGVDNYFLTLFGKPLRESNCDCERTTEPTLLQTLYTENDPTLMNRIDYGRNGDPSWIGQLRREKTGLPPTDTLITQLFLRTVSRPPTPAELEHARADVAAARTPVDGLRDLMWAMLNTREFKVNH